MNSRKLSLILFSLVFSLSACSIPTKYGTATIGVKSDFSFEKIEDPSGRKSTRVVINNNETVVPVAALDTYKGVRLIDTMGDVATTGIKEGSAYAGKKLQSGVDHHELQNAGDLNKLNQEVELNAPPQ